MTTYDVKKKSEDFKLGDVVRMGPGGFMTAVVIKIEKPDNWENSLITLFRPYVHTSDVETTGGIIPYIGSETYTIYGDNLEYHCYETDKDIK